MIVQSNKRNGGVQHFYRLPNNFGASVIRNDYSYGGDAGLWELAVIKFDSEDNDDWDITYKTDITDDVLGHLSDQEVQDNLKLIEELKEDA